MIIDLPRFLEAERPYWTELEQLLARQEDQPSGRLGLEEAQRLHYLYERATADLARLTTFVGESESRRYVESLVARAYAEIHGAARRRVRFEFGQWLFRGFPSTFRKHAGAFRLAVLVTLVGCAFGVAAMRLDAEAKEALMPFAALMESPAERVAREESGAARSVSGHKGSFSAMLMTHNTRVAVLTLALGMTFGVGTLVVLFFNGVMLGAVCADYVMAGQARFLAGWLLPHGSIEIPAILVAGQAGLVLAGALLGRGDRLPLAGRLRQAAPDIATLVGGAAVMLVWAGLVESFFSQNHEPELPYELKILFGLVELGLLAAFLGWSGRRPVQPQSKSSGLRATAKVASGMPEAGR